MYTVSFIRYKVNTLRKHSNSNMNNISNSGFDKENKAIFFHLLYTQEKYHKKKLSHIQQNM